MLDDPLRALLPCHWLLKHINYPPHTHTHTHLYVIPMKYVINAKLTSLCRFPLQARAINSPEHVTLSSIVYIYVFSRNIDTSVIVKSVFDTVYSNMQQLLKIHAKHFDWSSSLHSRVPASKKKSHKAKFELSGTSHIQTAYS